MLLSDDHGVCNVYIVAIIYDLLFGMIGRATIKIHSYCADYIEFNGSVLEQYAL